MDELGQLPMKSHNIGNIQKALEIGEVVYFLDTGNDGEDDVLIGNLEEVKGALCNHFKMDALPDHWKFTELETCDGQKINKIAQGLKAIGWKPPS